MGTIAPYSPKKMEAEGPKREKTGKRKERRRGKRKEQEKGKRNEMQIFFFFSLLVDIYGFIDGRGRDCVILHDEGLLFYSKSLFPERFQREPMGRKHASSESSPIRRELRTQRLPAALPLVNKLFLQLLLHYIHCRANNNWCDCDGASNYTCN